MKKRVKKNSKNVMCDFSLDELLKRMAKINPDMTKVDKKLTEEAYETIQKDRLPSKLELSVVLEEYNIDIDQAQEISNALAVYKQTQKDILYHRRNSLPEGGMKALIELTKAK